MKISFPTLFTSLLPSLLLALSLTSCGTAPVTATESIAAPAGKARSVEEFNLHGNLALHGYDPVSYWPEGGSQPVKGQMSRSVDYGGAVYLFANDANRQAFKADPTKYEPAHGGWCSYAMKDGSAVDVDPETFILEDGRLFLFYNDGSTDTKALWNQEAHRPQVDAADRAWTERSN